MKFSVIIPTHNRLESLKRTIASLGAQSFRDFEIIVVNDGSTDGTDAYCSSLAAAGKINYRSHPNSGLAATRHAGLAVARGQYVAFTDDDCILPPDWLKKILDAFAGGEVAGVGGASRTGDPSNICAEANDMINNYLKEALNTSGTKALFLTGNNVAYKRAALDAVGGPDSRFLMGAEDRDLAYRVVCSGGRLRYDPSIIVDHFNDARFRGFLRHQFDQGKGSWLFYSLHGKGEPKPPRIPPGVYAGLLWNPFRVRPPVRALRLLILILLAQAAVTAGFLAAAISRKSPAPSHL